MQESINGVVLVTRTEFSCPVRRTLQCTVLSSRTNR